MLLIISRKDQGKYSKISLLQSLHLLLTSSKIKNQLILTYIGEQWHVKKIRNPPPPFKNPSLSKKLREEDGGGKIGTATVMTMLWSMATLWKTAWAKANWRKEMRKEESGTPCRTFPEDNGEALCQLNWSHLWRRVLVLFNWMCKDNVDDEGFW